MADGRDTPARGSALPAAATRTGAGAPGRRAPAGARGYRRWLRPEFVPMALLVVAFLVSQQLSPYFLDPRFLLSSTSEYMEVGFMALSMTLVIVAGQIDLSVASGLALVGTVVGLLHRAGVPMGWDVLLGLVLGVLLGLFHGLLVVRLGLPSLTVTLGTLALYRGLAKVLLGSDSIGKFPAWFAGVDQRMLAGLVPLPLVLFGLLAVAFGLVLHRTVFGRWVYALGTNEAAARYAGVPVDRVKLLIFVLSGLMSALGGLVMISRLGVARFDLASGNELDVITAVVLGGADIYGGKGTLLGTVVALFLIGILRTGMGLANIRTEDQLTVIGSLLILAFVLANLVTRLQASGRARPSTRVASQGSDREPNA